MQCPLSDGELIAHTTQGENNLTVSYSTCPACRGYWMSSFAANFIKLAPAEYKITGVHPPQSGSLKCPVCSHPLTRATGMNIPDAVQVYKCDDNHGYFFPSGQLAAFKKAQEVKIQYHKLWNLPLLNVASVLLAGFFMLIVGGGILSAFVALQHKETISSQAQSTIHSEHAIVDSTEHAVIFTAETGVKVNLFLSVPLLNINSPMTSLNNNIYTSTLWKVPSGTFTYSVYYTENGQTIRSPLDTFTMPQ